MTFSEEIPIKAQHVDLYDLLGLGDTLLYEALRRWVFDIENTWNKIFVLLFKLFIPKYITIITK